VCSVCNVSCTSIETMQGHATGKKHVRRVSLVCLSILQYSSDIVSRQAAAWGSREPQFTSHCTLVVLQAQAARNAAHNGGSGAAQQNGQAAPAAAPARPPAADANGAAQPNGSAQANGAAEEPAAPAANGSSAAAGEAKGAKVGRRLENMLHHCGGDQQPTAVNWVLATAGCCDVCARFPLCFYWNA